MKLKKYLTEKQIIVGGGKKYGQIVFLAGGAGSGKGFSSKNFMELSKFKVRDVDELKKSAIKLAKLKQDNPEIANLDLSIPEDVFRLHQYVKDKGWKDETLKLLLQGAQNKETLPNILFDTTLRDEGDIYEVLPILFEVGYQPINIHLVWILTDYEIAVKQNNQRERKVPYDILLMTHEGAALTMTDLLRGKIKGIGTLIDGQVNIIFGGDKHTVYMTTLDTKETIKGKNKFVQLGGEKIKRPIHNKFTSLDKPGEEVKHKETLVIKSFKYVTIKYPGKPMRSSDDFSKELYNWDDIRALVKSSIPKTTKTRNIRKRKRI